MAAMNERRREFASRSVPRARCWAGAKPNSVSGWASRNVINRLEQAGVDVRRSTAVAIEGVLRDEGTVRDGAVRAFASWIQPRRKRSAND